MKAEKCSTNHENIDPDKFVFKLGGLLCPECRTILYEPGTPMFKIVSKYRAAMLEQVEKLQPMGEITLELENVLQKMAHDHDLQWGEILGLVHTWLNIHAPSNQEEYVDGGSPVYYYGTPKK